MVPRPPRTTRRSSDLKQNRFFMAQEYGIRDHGFSGKIRHPDRKSTRLNSSHLGTSYAVFCWKKKNKLGRPEGSMTSKLKRHRLEECDSENGHWRQTRS